MDFEPTSGFRSQLLWQKAQALALALISVARDLPNERAADSIGRQLIRAGTSIAASIAEGYGLQKLLTYRMKALEQPIRTIKEAQARYDAE
jgi:four helix bundle protein